jgi:hypothetical protein
LSLSGRQDGTIRTKQFQTVPRRGIVAGGDLQPARPLQPAHRQTQRRRRSDADVLNLAAGTEQTGQHGVAKHGPAGSAILAQDDSASLG